jgi:multiple sugar transport system substrate-binding protein
MIGMPCSAPHRSLALLLAGATVLTAVTVGCSGRPAATTVLEVWAMGQEGEALARLVTGFEREEPNVEVRVQQIPWSAAHEKLLTAYVGGTMPDVFQIGSTWVSELAALGALEPLDDRVAASSIDTDDFFEGALSADVIDDTLFALPWYVDTRLLFYRSDLLAEAGYHEPPRSWPQWVAAMERVRTVSASKGNGDAYAILLPMGEWEAPVILAMQLGADLLRDGGRFGNFESEPFRHALSFYVDLFERGLAPRSGVAQVANVYQDFAAGYFSFYLTGPWNLGEFRRRLPAALQSDWTTAPLPSPDGDEPGTSLAGGASLALFARSDHADTAWRLVEYLSDPARQTALYEATGDLPSRKSAWTHGGLSDRPPTRAFRIQLDHVRPPPKVPEWEQIAQRIGRAAESAVRGDQTIETALADLDADSDRILEKRRWMLARRAAPGDDR